MRFLFAWQRVDPDQRAAGLEGLASVIAQLDGFEVPAAAWESDVLSSRVTEYDPTLLDTLCMMGRVAWGRVSAGQRGGGAAAADPDSTARFATLLCSQSMLPNGSASKAATTRSRATLP